MIENFKFKEKGLLWIKFLCIENVFILDKKVFVGKKYFFFKYIDCFLIIDSIGIEIILI